MTTICQCGKEIKGNYNQCFDCHKKNSIISTPTKAEEVKPSSPLGINDRILKSQCLNISATIQSTLTGDINKIIDYADKLYNEIKKRKYL